MEFACGVETQSRSEMHCLSLLTHTTARMRRRTTNTVSEWLIYAATTTFQNTAHQRPSTCKQRQSKVAVRHPLQILNIQVCPSSKILTGASRYAMIKKSFLHAED